MIASAKRYMTAFAAAALIAVAVSACGGGGGGTTVGGGGPENVTLLGLTSGFMANAGTVTIEAGQSTDHGDVEFTCAAGGADCEVMVEVDANGGITATSTGGMVTAKDSDAYNTRITPMNVELDSVTPGFMAGSGTVQVAAGRSVVHGDVEFTCTAGGADCEVG